MLRENFLNRIDRSHAIAAAMVLGEYGGTEDFRFRQLAISGEYFFRVVKLCV